MLNTIMKKLAKTNDKVVVSVQVSINIVPVSKIPSDKKLIRNAETVNEKPKPTFR